VSVSARSIPARASSGAPSSPRRCSPASMPVTKPGATVARLRRGIAEAERLGVDRAGSWLGWRDRAGAAQRLRDAALCRRGTRCDFRIRCLPSSSSAVALQSRLASLPRESGNRQAAERAIGCPIWRILHDPRRQAQWQRREDPSNIAGMFTPTWRRTT